MTGLSHLFHDNYTGYYINYSDILQGNKCWTACDLKNRSDTSGTILSEKKITHTKARRRKEEHY